MKTRIRLFLFCLTGLMISAIAQAGNLEKDILNYTNQYRRAQGKPELRSAPVLDEQAARHSSNMAGGKTPFGHNGFKDRVNAASKDIGRISAAAENVAYGDMDAREVVDGWIKSKPHRKNMLGEIGRAHV